MLINKSGFAIDTLQESIFVCGHTQTKRDDCQTKNTHNT